jgi:hypothetical protein
MRYLRLLLGVLSIAIGVLLGLGDLFLLLWSLLAGRAHDIRARGPWLLAFMMPEIALASAFVTLGVTIGMARRGRWPLWALLGVPPLATLAAVAACYLDPHATLWRAMRPIRQTLHLGGAFLLDAILIGVGVWLIRAREAAAPSSVGEFTRDAVARGR